MGWMDKIGSPGSIYTLEHNRVFQCQQQVLQLHRPCLLSAPSCFAIVSMQKEKFEKEGLYVELRLVFDYWMGLMLTWQGFQPSRCLWVQRQCPILSSNLIFHRMIKRASNFGCELKWTLLGGKKRRSRRSRRIQTDDNGYQQNILSG